MLGSADIKKIDAIYRLMKVKGVGPVLTNKILLSIERGVDADRFCSKINSMLNDSQRDCFIRSESVIDGMTSPYHVGFMSIVDDGYPVGLKEFLSSNTPPVLSFIGNLNLLSKKKVAFSGS